MPATREGKNVFMKSKTTKRKPADADEPKAEAPKESRPAPAPSREPMTLDSFFAMLKSPHEVEVARSDNAIVTNKGGRYAHQDGSFRKTAGVPSGVQYLEYDDETASVVEVR